MGEAARMGKFRVAGLIPCYIMPKSRARVRVLCEPE